MYIYVCIHRYRGPCRQEHPEGLLASIHIYIYIYIYIHTYIHIYIYIIYIYIYMYICVYVHRYIHVYQEDREGVPGSGAFFFKKKSRGAERCRYLYLYTSKASKLSTSSCGASGHLPLLRVSIGTFVLVKPVNWVYLELQRVGHALGRHKLVCK